MAKKKKIGIEKGARGLYETLAPKGPHTVAKLTGTSEYMFDMTANYTQNFFVEHADEMIGKAFELIYDEETGKAATEEARQMFAAARETVTADT